MRSNIKKVIVSLLMVGILFSGVIAQAKDYAKEKPSKPRVYRLSIDPPSEPPMN